MMTDGRTVDRHGAEGGFWRTLRQQGLGAAGRRLLERLEGDDADFDRELGIDTAMESEAAVRDVVDGDPENAGDAGEFMTITPKVFSRLMDSLRLQCESRVLVDPCCGKGRTLLLASAWPFRRIIGHEPIEALREKARQNVEAGLAARKPRCSAVEVREGEVADCELPPEDLLIVLSRPLPEQSLDVLVERIGQSLREHPREILLAYFTPLHWQRVSGADCLDLLRIDQYRGLGGRPIGRAAIFRGIRAYRDPA